MATSYRGKGFSSSPPSITPRGLDPPDRRVRSDSPPSRSRRVDDVALSDSPPSHNELCNNPPEFYLDSGVECVEDDDFDWDAAITDRYGVPAEETKTQKPTSKAQRRLNILEGPNEKPRVQLTIEQKIKIFQENRRRNKWRPAPKMFRIEEIDFSDSDFADSDTDPSEPARKKRDSSPVPTTVSAFSFTSAPPPTTSAIPSPAGPTTLPAPSPPSISSSSPSSSTVPIADNKIPSVTPAAPLSPTGRVAPPPPPFSERARSVSADVVVKEPETTKPRTVSSPRSAVVPPIVSPHPIVTRIGSGGDDSSRSSSDDSNRGEELPMLATLRDLVLQKQKALGTPGPAPGTALSVSLEDHDLLQSPVLDKLTALQQIIRKRGRDKHLLDEQKSAVD